MPRRTGARFVRQFQVERVSKDAVRSSRQGNGKRFQNNAVSDTNCVYLEVIGAQLVDPKLAVLVDDVGFFHLVLPWLLFDEVIIEQREK